MIAVWTMNDPITNGSLYNNNNMYSKVRKATFGMILKWMFVVGCCCTRLDWLYSRCFENAKCLYRVKRDFSIETFPTALYHLHSIYLALVCRQRNGIKRAVIEYTLNETGMEMWKERNILHELQFSLKNHFIIEETKLTIFHSPLIGWKSTFCHEHIGFEESLRVFSIHIWLYYFIISFL